MAPGRADRLTPALCRPLRAGAEYPDRGEWGHDGHSSESLAGPQTNADADGGYSGLDGNRTLGLPDRAAFQVACGASCSHRSVAVGGCDGTCRIIFAMIRGNG